MNKCKVKILRDFIAVQDVAAPDNSSRVIEVVRFDDRLKKGKVVAKGTGVLTANGQQHPIEIELGDLVVFDKTNCREVVHGGEKYFILNELSVLAILLDE